jgi:hypothetical protein
MMNDTIHVNEVIMTDTARQLTAAETDSVSGGGFGNLDTAVLKTGHGAWVAVDTTWCWLTALC